MAAGRAERCADQPRQGYHRAAQGTITGDAGQGVERVQASEICVGTHPILQGSCVELDGIPDQRL